MFRKAQLKIFAIITCILLAVFIAVLGSINIIMNTLTDRQSRNTLRQIAEGIEFDNATSTFSFVRPSEFKEPQHDPPPPHYETSAIVTTAVKTTITITNTRSTAKTTAVSSSSTAASAPATTLSSEAPTIHVYITTTITHSTVRTPTTQTTAASAANTSPITTAKTEKATNHTNPQTAPPKKTAPPTRTTTVNSKTAPTTAATTASPHESEKPTKPEESTKPEQQFPWQPPEWDGQYPQFPIKPSPPDNWWNDHNTPVFPPNFGSNIPWDSSVPDESKGSENSIDKGYQWYQGIQQTGSDVCDEGRIVMLGSINETERSKTDRKNNRPNSEPVPKSLGTMNFFIIMSDPQGKYLAKMNNDDLSESTAQTYITEILEADTKTGRLNNYQFYMMKKDNGTLMVFTDKRAENDMLRKLIRTTVMIGLISFIILSAAAFFLSVQIVKPLKTAFEKQKQFVSDASHELKTPVTVISANADVLSDEIGDNKWLNYIKSQTERMNVLVNDLLNLTRLENKSTDFIRTDFDASKAMINTILPFECQAFESNKKFIVDIDDGIIVNGSEKHIKQMAAIFIDNALKYSNNGGTVRVTFKSSGEKKVLSVFNTGSGVKAEDVEKIFERFYRSDESRNRSTGGYGLGLAIARSIIDRHKFKIAIENHEGESICFIITM